MNGFLMARSRKPEAGVEGNAGAESQGETELASVKGRTNVETKGRNQKRLEILKEWYVVFCSKHNNNRELIIEELNRLTNAEILTELANFRPEDKCIWTIKQATRWLGQNGKTVWGFERTQVGKPKKRI